MRLGGYISGAAHAGFIGWVFWGFGFASEPLDMDALEMTMISGAAFDAALKAGQAEAAPAPVSSPRPISTTAPSAPASATETVPEAVLPAARPEPTMPDRPDALAPSSAPEPVRAPLPAPPVMVPEIDPKAPVAPLAAPAPNVEIGESLRPKSRPETRLAPLAAAEQDAPAAVSEAAAPSPVLVPDTEPQPEEAAPEAAATEVVTEAEKPSFAPEISRRPQARPANLSVAPPVDASVPDDADAPPDQPAPTEAPVASQTDVVAAALAQALAGGGAPAQGNPDGQNLTGEDIGSLVGQISQCWPIDTASTDVLRTTVALTLRFGEDGRVLGAIERAGYEGGTAQSADIAYRYAEQAVLECQDRGRNGYDLPVERFPFGRALKIKFNPEAMRLR